MPRVSGEFHSQNHGRKQGQGLHPKTERDPWGYHGKWAGELITGQKYVKRTGHHFDVVPRPYKSGVVGSHGEIDWSVRSSYIPNGFTSNMIEYGGIYFEAVYGLGTLRSPGYERQKKIRPKPENRPPKGFGYFGSLSHNQDSHVIAWTKFANKFGIRYSGDRYYLFPKGMTGILDARSGLHYKSPKDPFSVPEEGKEKYEFLKLSGAIKHKRSELSKIRRHARRALDLAIRPLEESDLLRRTRISRKCAKKTGYSTSDRPELLVIPAKRGMSVPPPIVVKAIKKLFSKKELFYVPYEHSGRAEPVKPRYVARIATPVNPRTYRVGVGTLFRARKMPERIARSTIGVVPYDESLETQEYFSEPFGEQQMTRVIKEFDIVDGKPTFASGWW